MKINELQNRVNKDTRVILYEEIYPRGGEVHYRVDTFVEKRGIEKRIEQMPFRNRKAAEHYAQYMLTGEH